MASSRRTKWPAATMAAGDQISASLAAIYGLDT